MNREVLYKLSHNYRYSSGKHKKLIHKLLDMTETKKPTKMLGFYNFGGSIDFGCIFMQC